MNKHLFKIIVNSLNDESLVYSSQESLLERTFNQVKRDFNQVTSEDIMKVLYFLNKTNSCERTQNGLDLYPCAIVYARSMPNSMIEALAAFEICSRHPETRKIFQSKDIYDNDFDQDIYEFLSETNLFKNHRIDSDYKQYTDRILNEDSYFFSDTLNVLYTQFLFEKTDHLNYRNMELPTIHFSNKDFILSHIPKLGIPENRDSTKQLQTFFKDTLMHEFDHECPLCHINMPHMLIASHIKPFRDCSHIYEPAVHDNGLLLCRNHDYLFDQGYISFDDSGQLLISKQITNPKAFYLPKDYKLQDKYLTENRLLFFQYHREHIFKK